MATGVPEFREVAWRACPETNTIIALNKCKRQLNHTFKTNLKNGRLLLPINSGGINEPISK
ncbi:hypothetical protein BPLS_P5534 [Bathymodiolus platifrons methanotrophic gill symbiont]|nr:hypothetical protein BPLS_P5534 [Bathymodiolus platifrons methanotrophic gill symbiont]